MQFESNKSLATLNTLGFDQRAEYYIDVNDEYALSKSVAYAKLKGWPLFILGSGSNLVLTRDISGLIIHQTGQHIQYQPELNQVTAAAGVNWHELVRDSVSRGYAGLENLSLIPGTVGAAPVQNIGAYGVELVDRFISLRALHLGTNQWHTFNRSECEFDYRCSLFKRQPSEWAISSVTLQVGEHIPINTHYASLTTAIENSAVTELTPTIVSDFVCRIRRAKLPDPALIGNAGSFFKNPLVNYAVFDQLKTHFPDIIAYRQSNDTVKLAAGWLVDSLGYRGLRRGAVGVHAHQALVLIHHGGGTGIELLALANEIRDAVQQRYGVALETEPVIV